MKKIISLIFILTFLASCSNTGGSCCSIMHCGVHKIDSDLATAFFKVGNERATRVYEFLKRNFHIKSIEKSVIDWEKCRDDIRKMSSIKQIKYYKNFRNRQFSAFQPYEYINVKSHQEYHILVKKHRIKRIKTRYQFIKKKLN